MIFLTISQQKKHTVDYLKINLFMSKIHSTVIFLGKMQKVNVMHTNYSSITISACLTKCKNACLTEVEEIHSAEMF